MVLTLYNMEVIMDKITELPSGSPVDFKLTVCPSISSPVMQGVLHKYCRLPGWQSILTQGEKRVPVHYPVRLAVIELKNGHMVRVDAKSIIVVNN